MISDLIPKLAEFEREDDHEYFPRPSCAGPERCIRQMVYWGMKAPRQPLPGRSLLVFDDGNWHEELTKDWLRKSAYQVHSDQMPITVSGHQYGRPGIVLHGHIDFILTDPLGKDTLVEHKAINHFTWQKYAEGDLPLDYLTQAALYFAGFHGINPDLREGLLLVKNKNTAQYLELALDYDFKADCLTVAHVLTSTGEKKQLDRQFPGIILAAFAKFGQVDDLLKAKTLPPRQYDMDHWRCSYCQWGATCWATYGEEFAAMATGADIEDIRVELAYANQLGAEAREAEAAAKKAKADIMARMKAMSIRQGRTQADDNGVYYAAEIKAMHRDSYTVEAADYEQLTIRKVQPKAKEKKP